MPTPRVTRGFYSRIPRYSTNYSQPFNWTLLSGWDVLPLFVVLLAVDWASAWFFPLIVLGVLWLCVRLGLRLRARGRDCAEHGHDPYRPVPEVAEYRCWRCDQPLEYPPVEGAVEAMRTAQVTDAPQSRWSDRR